MKFKSALLATTVGPLLAFTALPSVAQKPDLTVAQAQTEPSEQNRRREDRSPPQATPDRSQRPDSREQGERPASPPPRAADAPRSADQPRPVQPPRASDRPAAPDRPPEPRRATETPRTTGPGRADGPPAAAPPDAKPPVPPAAERRPDRPAPARGEARPVVPPRPAEPPRAAERPSPVKPPEPPAQADRDRPSVVPAIRPPAIVDQARARRLEDLQGSRTESREEGRTTIREGNRTITREGGRGIIRHDDLDRFRGGGREVSVQQRGREVVTTVARPDRTRVVTVVDADGRLMRRSRLDARGRETVIIDNRRARGQGSRPFVDLPPPAVRIPLDRYVVAAGAVSAAVLYETLRAPPVDRLERAYALDEIRYSSSLRDRMRRIDIDTLTFDTGSWEVKPDQAAQLEQIADAMRRAVKANPAELFLIEGHTDAVGSDIDNLSLSDRRAEAVAATLSERFAVPPENLVTQGYGEEFPKIATDGPERQNRRVAVRRITPLMTGKPARS